MKKLLVVLCSLTILLGAGWPQPKRITVANCSTTMYKQFVDIAITDWNSFKVVKMVQIGCDESADIVVRHSSYGDMPPIADTNLLYDTRWNIQKAIIRLNSDVLDLPTIPDKYRRYVVAHEFGHALGLPHNQVQGSVMSVVDGNVWVPTYIDGQLLQSFYKTPRK